MRNTSAMRLSRSSGPNPNWILRSVDTLHSFWTVFHVPVNLGFYT